MDLLLQFPAARTARISGTLDAMSETVSLPPSDYALALPALDALHWGGKACKVGGSPHSTAADLMRSMD